MAPNRSIRAGSVYRPIIPVTLALMEGILLGERFAGAQMPVVTIAVAIFVWVAVRLSRRSPGILLPLLLCMCAGYLSIQPWVVPDRHVDHVIHFLNSGRWQVAGEVDDSPLVRGGRTRLVMGSIRLSREGRSHAVRGRLRLTVMGEIDLLPGDRIAFSATLRPFRNFQNPGALDYRRHMAFRDIHGSAWVKSASLQRLDYREPSPVRRMLFDVRHRIAAVINASHCHNATSPAVLKALVMGDRSGITQDLRERFNRSGAGHLLAISGLHVGIVAAAAFGLFRWLFSFVPFLLWRGWGRRWAAVATLAPVLAYGLLSGMSASTQRAIVMTAVFLTAMIIGRRQDTINTLAVAALIILAVFPPALFSISFQLSFTAVLMIVYGFSKLRLHPETTRDRGLLRRLVSFICVSALAIIGTAPVVALYFNQTSLVGIAANLLLVPLVGFLAVPLGLAAAVLSLICQPLAALACWMALHLIDLALAIVDFFSTLSFAAVKVVTPSFLEIGIYYIALWALLNIGDRRWVKWVLAVVVVVGVGDALYWGYQRFWHRDLKVTAIDVGQGGATLLELPGGSVMLYDGGGFADNRRFDMGRLVVAPLLWRRKIASVDILVLSHPNADHLNGLIYIARHFNVRELWTNGDVNTTLGYQDLMEACHEKGISVRTVHDGCPSIRMGQVVLDILNPDAGFATRPFPIDQKMRNSASIVLKATFGRTGFLLTGDIQLRAERAMLGRHGAKLRSTVLFSPHHGSRSSSSQGLVSAVRPRITVISAGAGNRFGFPHEEVLQRYRRVGSRIVCTCSHGAVCMRSDGNRVRVRTVAGPGFDLAH
ncbi:MAG: DNA internalization-related competence protein ComEC/Rec2 [Proteobacteria bacterium]|nr:MAG: DNA internalization-related competence protein ComEC/Rec2 [Pseudomonadota bacterium]